MRRIVLVLVFMTTLFSTPHAKTRNIELRLLSPTQGASIYGNTIIVRVETPGLTFTRLSNTPRKRFDPQENRDGQGHLLLMLDLQVLVVWDTSEPYALLNVPPGQHLLTVELVQNDSSSFTPPIVEQIVFTTTNVETPALVLPDRLSTVAGESSDAAIDPYAYAALGPLYMLMGGQIR